MNIFDAYETDKELTDLGVWCELYAPGGGKVGRVRVRPADVDLNADYRKALNVISQRIATLLQDGRGDVGEQEDLQLMSEAYSIAIVTDWEITGRDGAPIPFTAEAARQYMLDMPKFYKAIRQAAAKWTNYRKKFEDDAVKT